MSERLQILQERELTHGDFKINAAVSQSMKHQLKTLFPQHWDRLARPQKEALDMICAKLGRILANGGTNPDDWVDIAGYAHLGGEACES